MNVKYRFTALLLLLLGTTLSASSMTFLIETRDRQPRATMDLPNRLSIVSAETGIMDTLFDRGHIFFNIYSAAGKSTEGQMDNTTLKSAGEEGAAYLLILIPEEKGIRWKLFDVPKKNLMLEDFSDLALTDSELKSEERWMMLGTSLAEVVLAKIR